MTLPAFDESRRESHASNVSESSTKPNKVSSTEPYQYDDFTIYENSHMNFNVFSSSKFKTKIIVGLIIVVTTILLSISQLSNRHKRPQPYDVHSAANINLSGVNLLRYFEDNIHSTYGQVSYYDDFRGYIDDLSVKSGISQTEILTRDVSVLQYVHSHNDYWRKLPFYDAILHGVNSIEADIWFLEEEKDNLLAVGHSKDYLKPKQRNLNTLYLDPIKKILDQNNNSKDGNKLNGIFFNSPEVPTILYIDFKNDKTQNLQAYDELIKELKPLKKYLTTQLDFDKNEYKPLIIELTGNFPELSNYEDFIFLDSSMIKVFKKEVQFKSPVVSESLDNLIGFCTADDSMSLVKIKSLDSDDMKICLKTLINQLHDQNYKVRIWGVPQFPVYNRDVLWKQQLNDFQVDFLNVDDLDSVTTF
ncbi:hypothetical protein ACO0OE_000290 [Hanseniaspora uvarum]